MSKYSGNTDKVNEVKLTSKINSVIWTSVVACPGAKVGIQVYTDFVGNNSDIKVEISDKSGKTFETLKGKVSGNKFWKQITVPEKAMDELFAEAKLSKHSLSKKSNGLYLFPLVEIKNLKWDKQEARRGDILKLTADIKGLADGNEAELQIWEHDADQAHDLVTKFPVAIRNNKIETEWEFQYVDDTDDIPTEEESENGYQWPEYFFRVVCAGKSADSGLLKFNDWIELEFLDNKQQPRAGIEVKIKFPDGTTEKKKTDDNGLIKIEDVPPGKFIIESAE